MSRCGRQSGAFTYPAAWHFAGIRRRGAPWGLAGVPPSPLTRRSACAIILEGRAGDAILPPRQPPFGGPPC